MTDQKRLICGIIVGITCGLAINLGNVAQAIQPEERIAKARATPYLALNFTDTTGQKQSVELELLTAREEFEQTARKLKSYVLASWQERHRNEYFWGAIACGDEAATYAWAIIIRLPEEQDTFQIIPLSDCMCFAERVYVKLEDRKLLEWRLQ